jgi:nucleotidyltransferase/DNA polymerase involved in DNA repair
MEDDLALIEQQLLELRGDEPSDNFSNYNSLAIARLANYDIADEADDMGTYITNKRAKTRIQFQHQAIPILSDTNNQYYSSSNFFTGICVWFNGNTHPPVNQLKELLYRHGGTVENVLNSYVTHIVAEWLPSSKIKEYKLHKKPRPHILPSWIVNCVKADQLLDVDHYILPELKDSSQNSLLQFKLPRVNKNHNNAVAASLAHNNNLTISDTSNNSATISSSWDLQANNSNVKKSNFPSTTQSVMKRGNSAMKQPNSLLDNNAANSILQSAAAAVPQNSFQSPIKPSLSSMESHHSSNNSPSTASVSTASISTSLAPFSPAKPTKSLFSTIDLTSEMAVPANKLSFKSVAKPRIAVKSENFDGRSAVLSARSEYNHILMHPRDNANVRHNTANDPPALVKTEPNIANQSNPSHSSAKINQVPAQPAPSVIKADATTTMLSQANVAMINSTEAVLDPPNSLTEPASTPVISRSAAAPPLSTPDSDNSELDRALSNYQFEIPQSEAIAANVINASIDDNIVKSVTISNNFAYPKARSATENKKTHNPLINSTANFGSNAPSNLSNHFINPHENTANSTDATIKQISSNSTSHTPVSAASNFAAPAANKPNSGHLARSTLNDPDFVSHFFESSRLHFIGTWKKHFAELIPELLVIQPKFDSPGLNYLNSAPTTSSNRYVLHCDMDCFFASVALRDRPHLKNCPVAVCHSKAGVNAATSSISSANYIARQFGIGAETSIGRALQLCPKLIVLPYEFDKYVAVSDEIYRIFYSFSHQIQAVSLDEAYIELPGTLQPQQVLDIAAEIRREVERRSNGCRASIGVSYNLILARLATKLAKPDNLFYLNAANFAQHIDPLEITNLPGIGWKNHAKLKEKNIKTIGDLKKFSKSAVQNLLGYKSGEQIYNFARGNDQRKLLIERMAQSMAVDINWGIRFTENSQVKRFMYQVCEELLNRLRASGCKAYQLTVKAKKRAASAPEEPPGKFLGCGACDSFSKSLQVKTAITANPAVLNIQQLQGHAWELYIGFKIEPNWLRGFGVSLGKLEIDENCKSYAALADQNSGGAVKNLWERNSNSSGANNNNSAGNINAAIESSPSGTAADSDYQYTPLSDGSSFNNNNNNTGNNAIAPDILDNQTVYTDRSQEDFVLTQRDKDEEEEPPAAASISSARQAVAPSKPVQATEPVILNNNIQDGEGMEEEEEVKESTAVEMPALEQSAIPLIPASGCNSGGTLNFSDPIAAFAALPADVKAKLLAQFHQEQQQHNNSIKLAETKENVNNQSAAVAIDKPAAAAAAAEDATSQEFIAKQKYNNYILSLPDVRELDTKLVKTLPAEIRRELAQTYKDRAAFMASRRKQSQSSSTSTASSENITAAQNSNQPPAKPSALFTKPVPASKPIQPTASLPIQSKKASPLLSAPLYGLEDLPSASQVDSEYMAALPLDIRQQIQHNLQAAAKLKQQQQRVLVSKRPAKPVNNNKRKTFSGNNAATALEQPLYVTSLPALFDNATKRSKINTKNVSKGKKSVTFAEQRNSSIIIEEKYSSYQARQGSGGPQVIELEPKLPSRSPKPVVIEIDMTQIPKQPLEIPESAEITEKSTELVAESVDLSTFQFAFEDFESFQANFLHWLGRIDEPDRGNLRLLSVFCQQQIRLRNLVVVDRILKQLRRLCISNLAACSNNPSTNSSKSSNNNSSNSNSRVWCDFFNHLLCAVQSCCKLHYSRAQLDIQPIAI